VTWETRGKTYRNLTDLQRARPSGRYRALPSRRRYIPKADGKHAAVIAASRQDRPGSVVALLTPIYEAEFLGSLLVPCPDVAARCAVCARSYGIKAAKSTDPRRLTISASRFFFEPGWARKIGRIPIGDHRIIRLIQNGLRRVC